MDMKIIKSEKRLCTCCMEEHEVKTVLVEEQIQENDIHLKDAYREKEGLLTSGQIRSIREK